MVPDTVVMAPGSQDPWKLENTKQQMNNLRVWDDKQNHGVCTWASQETAFLALLKSVPLPGNEVQNIHNFM